MQTKFHWFKFNWICSWELLERATIITPLVPSKWYSTVLVSSHYNSWKSKNITTLSMHKGKLLWLHMAQWQLLRNNLENRSHRNSENLHNVNQQTQNKWVCLWDMSVSMMVTGFFSILVGKCDMLQAWCVAIYQLQFIFLYLMPCHDVSWSSSRVDLMTSTIFTVYMTV